MSTSILPSTDRSNDLLRFIFHGHWVDQTLGEAGTATHRVDDNDAQVLWTSPPIMATEVHTCADASREESVLAHLRAQLRIGAPKGELLGAQHPTLGGDGNADAPNEHELPDEHQNNDRP